jgi:hypothetical protein
MQEPVLERPKHYGPTPEQLQIIYQKQKRDGMRELLKTGKFHEPRFRTVRVFQRFDELRLFVILRLQRADPAKGIRISLFGVQQY